MVFGSPQGGARSVEEITAEIARGIEDAAETVRWWQAHRDDVEPLDTSPVGH